MIMANGIAEQRCTSIEIGGRVYHLARRKGTLTELEAEVLRLRPDPVELTAGLLRSAPPELHEMILGAFAHDMRCRWVSWEDVSEFEESPHGFAWKLWKLLSTNHPEVDSQAKAMELIEELGADRVEELKQRMTDAERA